MADILACFVIKNSEKYNGKDEYVILKYGFQTILEVLICSVSCITIAYFLNMFWECIMLLGIFLLRFLKWTVAKFPLSIMQFQVG